MPKLLDVVRVGACVPFVAALLMMGCPRPTGTDMGMIILDSGSGGCGNGVIEAPEQCDPPMAGTCDMNCMLIGGAVCGNGTVEFGEECDDGNTTPGDGCSATCTSEAGGCSTVTDLWMQNGCPGQNCTIVDMAGNLGCAPAGATADYAPCDGSVPCMAGSECTGIDPDFFCQPYCDQGGASTCPGGGTCLFNIMTAAGPVGLCALPDQCDLLAQDCVDAGDGCYIAGGTGSSTCFPAGTVAEGASCMFLDECMPGFACTGTMGAGVCSPLCSLTTGMPCAAPATCVTFGAALPAPNADVGFCM